MRNRLRTVNIFAFITLGLFLAVSAVLAVFILFFPQLAQQTALQTLITYAVGFGLPALIYGLYIRAKEGQRLADTFSFHRLPLKSLLLCLALGLLIQPIMSLVAALASLLFTDITTNSIEQMSEMPLPLFVLTIGVLPAFFEELVCRGMLLDGYRDTPLWYMLLIPALFFGLLHLNFQQISYAVVAGVILAYLVKITGSIWSSMTVHFVINGTQSLLVWLMGHTALGDLLGQTGAGSGEAVTNGALGGALDEAASLLSENQSGLAAVLSAAVMAGICLPFFLLCLYGLRRIHRFDEKKPALLAGRPNWHQGSLLMYILMGLMLVMALLVELLMPYLSELM